jgi:hypothetical protein
MQRRRITMQTYPVRYHVEHPAQFTRLQLLVRVVAFAALGVVGLSFGTVFFFAYLALPVVAASRLTTGDAQAYLTGDAPRIVRALRWFAAVSAWAGLITDRLPAQTPDEVLRVDVETGGHPTPPAAIWRILTGLPSAFVLCVLGCIGCFVWLWAALSILVTRRVGPGAFQYLVGLQRWSIRLLAYQASLVDEYPPFSFSDAQTSLPTARATL